VATVISNFVGFTPRFVENVGTVSSGNAPAVETNDRQVANNGKKAEGISQPEQLIRYFSQLAMCNLEQGRNLEAERFFARALNLAEQSFGENHPETYSAIETLAQCYFQQEKYSKAEPLFVRLLQSLSKCCQADDAILTKPMNELASVYMKMRKLSKAQSLYKILLERQEANFQANALELVPVVKALADCYWQDGSYAEAEAAYLRILAIQEFHFGTYSVEINETLRSIAEIFEKQDKLALAQFMLEKQQLILSSIHGEQAFSVASCSSRLAKLREKMAARVHLG
jgi:tetratricopeptide (TPR) repeat protein